jgi:hypothetical protein
MSSGLFLLIAVRYEGDPSARATWARDRRRETGSGAKTRGALGDAGEIGESPASRREMNVVAESGPD